jgi:hypothetical protein
MKPTVVMQVATRAGGRRFRPVDAGRATASNDEVTGDEVTGPSRDARPDIIAAGREPAGPHAPPGRLVRLLVVAQTAALVAAIALAFHYHAAAGRPGRATVDNAGQRAAALPGLISISLRLPARRPIAGTVLITAAASPGAARAQFTVSAVLTGGQPHTVYDLVGNDCSAAAPLSDHVWATGLTDAAGAARLRGYAWTGAVTDQFWLALSPAPAYGSPGLRGKFAQGSAAPYPAGHPPCRWSR